MDNTLISLENVSKTYPGVRALDNISMKIRRGEVHALVGENGAGKSTLIKIMTGTQTADEGSKIVIDGEAVVNLSPLQSVQKGIAVTYQDFSLFSNLSVAENIAISGEIEAGKKIVNWHRAKEIAHKAIARLEIDLDVEAPLGSLSTAKQQLVAIARALVYDAKIIILDEPTSSLSSNEVNALFGIIRNLKEKGISILFVSHKLDELFQVADRFTVLRDGRFIGTYEKEELDNEKLIALMVGRKVEYERVESMSTTQDELLTVDNLTKKGNYKNISFTLHKGEILGITGLVGAGRTEVCQSLFGLSQPDSGSIFLEGHAVTISNTEAAVKLGIAFIPESRLTQGLILRQSVEDNIVLTTLKQLASSLNIVNRKRKNSRAREWIKTLNVKPAYPDMLVSKLSGGNQQRVVIAKWLAASPRILIIDEPTNGIDVGAKREIHDLLRSLAQQGIGIIMISSELPEVMTVADRILVMRRGRIVAQLKGSEATQEEIMSKAVLC